MTRHDHVLASVIEAIGETPLVELARLGRGLDGRILAKLEYLNPGFSKKDRIARQIIEDAEADGRLTPGQTVVELTSGNTGTGLAIVCEIKGYQGPIYPVSAGATEPTTLAAVPNTDYLAALTGDIGTCLRLLGVFSQRLHAQIQEIEELTLESAGNRLIRHLARRAVRDPSGTLRVHFDETRQMLAAQLAIKPETLSRLTRALADEGLISADGRDIVIPDLERLIRHEM